MISRRNAVVGVLTFFLNISWSLIIDDSNKLNAQTANGGLAGSVNDNTKGFGVNSFLYTGSGDAFNTGTVKPKKGTIDWFKPLGAPATQRNIIEQTDSLSIVNLLSGPEVNPTYVRRQNGDISSKADIESSSKYNFLIDAVWARDNFGGSGAIDTTSYAVSSKNGQDPLLWGPGIAKVLGKNDLIDVAGHMFREIDSGATPKVNNLWFVGLINRAEPGGDAYMDFEFYVRDFGYNKTTQKFSYAGPDKGHTSFKFNPANGEITQLGDMLYNVSLTGGGTSASVEVRIWVSYADYTSVAPKDFTWGTEFDGAASGASHGYASIIPNPNTLYGYVNTAGQLPTVPPWGTRNTKGNTYTAAGGTYLEYSVSEVALNLTAIGLDNYLSAGANTCDFPWKTFMIKTRSSAAFSAALKDFAGPYAWGRPTAGVSGSTQTISCINPTATLTASPVRADATYSWSTTDGQIVGTSTSSTAVVDKAGTYNLSIALTNGCPVQAVPFVVNYDATKPVISSATATPKVSCTGSDGTVTLSVVGGSSPYTYSWTKDGSPFASTTQNLTGLSTGSYVATVTDKWGCQKLSTTALVTTPVSITATATITDVLCNGQSNGNINLTVLTGSSPFTYLWSNGKKTEDLSNVSAGTYTVTVTDKDGCSSAFGYTVAQPASALALSLTKVNNTNSTTPNGTATATVTGGTPSYTYSWTGPGGYTASTSSITGLSYGTYTVIVTDNNGCTATGNVIIYEPEDCDDGVDNDGDGLIDCNDPDCTTAAVTLTPSDANPCINEVITYTAGGTATQTYQWVVVPTNADATFNTSVTSQTFTVTWHSIAPAKVCVRAVSNGCPSTQQCLTVNPKQKPPQPITIEKE